MYMCYAAQVTCMFNMYFAIQVLYKAVIEWNPVVVWFTVILLCVCSYSSTRLSNQTCLKNLEPSIKHRMRGHSTSSTRSWMGWRKRRRTSSSSCQLTNTSSSPVGTWWWLGWTTPRSSSTQKRLWTSWGWARMNSQVRKE